MAEKKGNNVATAKKPKLAPKKGAEREKMYPTYETKTFAGDDALTADQAKEFLGWEEETEEIPFGDDYLFILNNRKIRTTKNQTNRPFDESLARKWAQEMLHKRWKLNGQSIGLGEYGNVLTGQHRLVGLVLAQDEVDTVTKKGSTYYTDIWGDSPIVAIDTDVTFGIDEGADTTQTIDTGKPCTLSDVVYKDQSFFRKATKSERVKLAKILEFAVRNMWQRTGTKKERANSFTPYLTHSEAMSFVRNHMRLERTSQEVFDLDELENDEGEKLDHIKGGTRLSLGECSALMYLMGAAATDGDEYHAMTTKSEKGISWDLWDAAVDFWGKVANGDDEMQGLRDAVSSLFHVASENQPTKAEKWACLINAWNLFKEGEELLQGAIAPSYSKVEKRELAETATLGGIDRVEEKEEEKENPDEDNPEEVEEAARIEREAALEATKDANAKKSREQLIKERHQAMQAAKASQDNGETTEGEEGASVGDDNEYPLDEVVGEGEGEVEEVAPPAPQRKEKKPKQITRKP